MSLDQSLGLHVGGPTPLRVLLIHEDVADRALIRKTVEGDDGAIVCDVADNYQGGEAAILDGRYDAYLVDHLQGTRSGIDLIREMEERAQGPLILLTGGREIDDEAVAAGAADCLEKTKLTTDGLRRAIRSAIRTWNERSRYRSVFDGVPVGLLRTTREALSVEVNATAVEMLGYPDKRSLMGEHLPDLFVDTPRISEALAVAPTGPVTVTDLEITKNDGTTMWVDVRLRPVFATGGVVGSIEWAMAEVTQRREAERQAGFRAELLDQVHSAVIVTDNDGIVTVWNRHAETMYGWTAAEAVGRPITELTVFEGDVGVASEIMEQIAVEGRWEGEFTVRRKDGSSFVAWVSNAMVTDELGAVAGVVGVSMDVTALRQAEAELRRSQQLIADAFEAAPIGNVITTPDLTIVSCNPAYAAFVGVPVGDLIGTNVRDLTHPDDIDSTQNAITGLVGGGTDGTAVDQRYIRSDGQIVWGRVHVSWIYDVDGRVTHALGQVVDITGTKRSEDQIRFQASVLDQVHHAVTATDPTGNIEYWNKRAETLFGWTASEVIGRNVAEVLFPNSATEFLADLYSTVSEHGMSSGEVAVRRKDGSIVPTWASYTVIRDPDGNPVSFVGVKIDLADIQQAEQHARSQADLNRTLLETVSVPIAVIDDDGQLVVANPSWERATHASPSPESYLPACIAELTSPGLLTELKNGIAGVLDGKGRFEIEYPCDEAGDDRWFRVVVVGAESGAVISHWDITDERFARAALEDTIRAKDAFIASVSHELRTPLTSVLGLSEMLRSGTVPTEDAAEIISLIADQAQEISLIVEDLLVAGRLESDTLTIHPSTVDLADETMTVIRPWSITGNADLEVEFTAGAALAFADPLRVRQILRILITNARRHGLPPVTITASMSEGRCVVQVTDRGKGIPRDAEARLFDPYSRFGPAGGQPQSVGLGLHVGLRLARLMGGDLSYLRQDSATIFELILPGPQAATDPND